MKYGNMTEIRWHGRGGQGAKTASQLLADAAFMAGMYVQSFPEYGPERSGAPITAYNRISDERCSVHSNIYEPDYVAVVDETLLKSVDVTSGLKEEGAVIINSEKDPGELRELLKGYRGRVCTIDARAVSMECLGAYFPNTPMLAAVVRVSGWQEFEQDAPDEDGEAVVEPSEGMLNKLGDILEHVQRPQLAVHFGTPADRILFAHPNDQAVNVMRHMLRKGYSHVPVVDRRGMLGVFSAGSMLMYMAENGLDDLRDELRVGELNEALDFGDERNEKYMFLKEDATVYSVRDAFQKRSERNSRLAVVFLTTDGTRQGRIVCMLTPWDVLRDGIMP